MSMQERTERLLGKDAVSLLKKKKAAVCGLGGVGGCCAEALARTGVGFLHLVDFDTVTESNINRQLFATKRTAGMKKTDAALARLRDVSDAEITVSTEKITEENAASLIPPDTDVIVDAVDDMRAKIALALYAKRHGIPEICCLGAGNRLDPSRFTLTDLYKTEGDPLARRMRNEMRKAGVGKLAVVYSPELPVKHETPGPIGSYAPAVTAAGMCAAAGALKILMNAKEERKMNASERYSLWCESPLVDEATKAELLSFRDDPSEIEDRFYQELSFGTAGLRGVLGAGDNRMNVYNVRKATEGLARYLEGLKGPKKVAIAYDSRHCSELFARETACVLAGHGIETLLYSTLHSVPQLSYTVVKLGCTAGVVITASHNPSKYNGYKVYWSHGGQVGPEQADEILARIREVPDFTAKRADYDDAVKNGVIRLLGEETDELYYADIETLLSDPAYLKAHGGEVSLVYTPLHGSGFVPVTKMMARIGVRNFFPVPEQSAPDGSFPTVTAPNPEDPAAFTLGKALAEEKHADLILATDPDADRLGAAVKKQDGTWAVLTGNQIASILLYTLLTSRKAAGKLPANGLCVRSMVSTRLADEIAKSFGAEMKEVLTGFRFISEQIALCEEKKEHTFLFGFEESYGYLAGTFARDKDSIVSAMLLSEAAVRCHAEGKTLYDVLQDIYEKYGFFAEGGKSYTLEGKAGIEKIGEAMKSLRKDPPETCGAWKITAVLDYEDSAATGLPKSNVLKFTLDDGSYFMARPSGTEPKLKLYTGTSAKTKAELDEKNAALLKAADGILAARLQ